MHPLKTGEAYDTITDRWTSSRFNRNNGIEQHKRALTFYGEATEHAVALDVGCGCTGRFFELLGEKGFTLEGIDASKKMLKLLEARNQECTLYHGDICTFTLPHKYDFITAWDSIWHVPLSQQGALITKLCHALKPGGVLIFTFGGTEKAGEHTNRTMGPEVYYASIGINGFIQTILDADCYCRHVEYDQHPELHTYIIAQRPTLTDCDD